MKILMLLTSHDTLGATGTEGAEKTGFWLEEFTAPYYVFKDAGADITLASPKGGQPPLDPKSEMADFQTADTERFNSDSDAQQQLANTLAIDKVSARDFDAIFYPGGHGPLWDLAEEPLSIALIEAFNVVQKPIAAVCHAPAVFRHAMNPTGSPIVSQRKVTGFSNSEEEAVGLTDTVPFLLENELKLLGGKYEKGSDWESHVVVDENLITGQNPASSKETAQALLTKLA
jgi:putative intracellular protease/amidase